MYRLRSTMSLLVRAVSTSEVRVDDAAAAARRASRGNAARGRSAGSALAEDRLCVTDSFLWVCQLPARDHGNSHAVLWDNGYLDVGSGVFGGQGDWACNRDGCEQHGGESGELHGDDGLFVVGSGVEGLLGQFFGCRNELSVEVDR